MDELRVSSAPSNVEAKVLAIPPPELLQGLREFRVIRLGLRVGRFVIHEYADPAHCSCLLRCAVNGHATADPEIPVMKSRRRIAFLKAWDHANCIDDYSRDLRPAEWAPTVILRGNNP